MHSGAIRQAASRGADKDTEAALLQYMHVMVVGIPHSPAGGVAARLLARRRVHAAHVAVAPLAESVKAAHSRYHCVVDVPLWRRRICHVRTAAGTVERDEWNVNNYVKKS